MKIGSYEITKSAPEQIPEKPPANLFVEISRGDSPWYTLNTLKPYNPDSIYQKKGDYSTFDEIREDDQINAILSLKKFMILDSKWEVECENEDISEFINYNLSGPFLDEIFEKKLFNILTALDYGFSITEKVFSRLDTKFGKKIVLTGLKTRPPHTIEIDQNEYGDIIQFRQKVYGSDLVIDPSKIIFYSYRKEFDNPYGRPEINLGVYRAWWSKNAIVKFYNIYLERFGMPTITGTYPQHMSKEKDNLLKVIKNIQAKAGIVVPEGIIIGTVGEKASGESGYKEAIDMHNQSIARSMLIPDLIGISGSKTSGGSYALGVSQFGIFYSIIQQTRREIQAIINKEIIDPLVKWNFGNGYDAKFRFEPIDENKRQSDMKLWLEAVNTGKIPVTDEHVNWFLSRVEAPEIDPAELQRIRDEKEAMQEQIQGGIEEKKEKLEEKKEDKEESEEEDSEEYTRKYEVEFYRELTEQEKRVNFAMIQRDLSGIEEQYKQELGKAFKMVIGGLINEVKTRKIIENKKIESVNNLRLKNYSLVKRIFKQANTESYKVGIKSTSKEVERAKKYAITDTETVLDNEDVATWLEQNAIYTSSVEAENILKIVRGNLLSAIRNGSSINETIKVLNEALRGYDIVLGAPRLETIIRNVTATAFNEARAQQFQAIGDEIVGYQYSAIMDGRTSPLCQRLDGRFFPPSQMTLYNPPLHHNCRSMIVPVFSDDEYGVNTLDMVPPVRRTDDGRFVELIKGA